MPAGSYDCKIVFSTLSLISSVSQIAKKSLVTVGDDDGDGGDVGDDDGKFDGVVDGDSGDSDGEKVGAVVGTGVGGQLCTIQKVISTKLQFSSSTSNIDPSVQFSICSITPFAHHAYFSHKGRGR